jgi:hypothetical protein
MFAKLFGYRVELIEHSPELTLVKSDTAVAVGTRIPVRVSGANGRRTPSVPMVVVSCRPSEHGGFLLGGKFLVDHPDLTGIELPPSINDSFARSTPRVNCHLCVLSRDLPGFRVMTIDLSEGGLQVEAPSQVETGTSVLLRVEFDTDKLPPIEASATVAWCSQQDRSKYRVGLRFTSIDERSKGIIKLYQELVARREEVDIQTRTSVGDLTIDLEDNAPLTSPMSVMKVQEWKQVPLTENTVLVGYMRAGSQLQVRLRDTRPGGRSREYVFSGLRGLHDSMGVDPSAVEIAQFRYTSVTTEEHRFQLLDRENNVLLEIEAQACREGLPESN